MGAPTLKSLAARLQQLIGRLRKTEDDVRGLKRLLNTKDNWAAEVRDLLGTSVAVKTPREDPKRGVLKWVDRYNIGLTTRDGHLRIYNKGQIIWIEPLSGGDSG